jgi:starch synthase
MQVADELARLDVAFAVLGSGDPRFETFWRSMAARYPGKLGVHTGYNERLAHLVEAGADMFLMPSLFEPCGLNQMYSQRYGTVPIVRATGGLDDTVDDYDERTGKGTGFKFKGASGRDLLDAVRRALAVYREPDRWRALQLAGMARDYSWDASAREYVKVYRRVLRGSPPGPTAAGPSGTTPVWP